MAKIEEGRCPYCGSDNLEYGTLEVGDDCVYYHVTCNSCKKNYREFYDMYFSGCNLDEAKDSPYLHDGDIYEGDDVTCS